MGHEIPNELITELSIYNQSNILKFINNKKEREKERKGEGGREDTEGKKEGKKLKRKTCPVELKNGKIMIQGKGQNKETLITEIMKKIF